jgi:hypothetical protein
MVHHQETRFPGWDTFRARFSICCALKPVFSATAAGE